MELERMVKALDCGQVYNALDVMTGVGYTAVKLASIAQKVTAIDITDEALNEAGNLAKEEDINNIEFLKMDVHDMSFPDNFFDIVCSRFAPHHFNNIEKALAEMVRVLKPGGKLYILDCSVIDGQLAEEVINRIEKLRDSSHKCSLSPEMWTSLIKKLPLDLQIIDLHLIENKLTEWFDCINTPEDKREEIFLILDSLPPTFKRVYPYSREFITAYNVELVAVKKG